MRPVFNLSMLYRIMAILGLWLLLGASAFASGGADCPGHGYKSKLHPTSAHLSHAPDAQAVQVAPPQASKPQPAFLPASLSEKPPFFSEADDACGSCVHCAACCFSVAPPLTLTQPVLQSRAGALFPPPVRTHPSPDLAALERPPQAA